MPFTEEADVAVACLVSSRRVERLLRKMLVLKSSLQVQ
jgi:hypothetical protein